jgi:hypothetical protein
LGGLIQALRVNSRLIVLGARCTLRAIARSVQPRSKAS